MRYCAHPGLWKARTIGTPPTIPYPRTELWGYFIYSRDNNDLVKSMWRWVMLGQYFLGFLLKGEHPQATQQWYPKCNVFSHHFPIFNMVISTRSPQTSNQRQARAALSHLSLKGRRRGQRSSCRTEKVELDMARSCGEKTIEDPDLQISAQFPWI